MEKMQEKNFKKEKSESCEAQVPLDPLKTSIDACWDGRFPKAWHEKLKASEVAIAGLGGLGSHIAVMLVRSGVGRLHLVDFDRVDISNLNRQEYDIRHLGRYKTEALAERLHEINPYVELHSDTVRVTSENAAKLFGGQSIVCEAFDVPEQKAMLVNALLEQCPNTVVVSGSGMAGIGDANCIQTRKVGRRLYLCGDGQTDVKPLAGLMAPRVSICAGHQANQVIRLILQQE